MPRNAFGYRNFRLFQTARFILTIAIQMQAIAVGWHIYELTHSALHLGFVGLVQFLPAIILALITGHTADRFDRQKILVCTMSGISVCCTMLAALTQFANASLPAMYFVLCILGTIRAFTGPASHALLPQLVPPERFGNALALGSSTWQIATVLGPSLGGLIYGSAGGALTVYIIAAVLACGAALLMTRVNPEPVPLETRAISWETVFAGIRYIWSEKIILGAMSLDLFAVLLGGSVALLPIYASDILHVGPYGLGILRSAPAAGAAVMAIILAAYPIVNHAGLKMFAGVATFGMCTLVFGLSKNFGLSLAALFVLGAADMISVVVRGLLVQGATPSAMRGRVSAVSLVFISASNELGEFESGLTASWFGTVPAVVIGGAGTLIVVAIWLVLFTNLRNANNIGHMRVN